ncbi:MAG: YbjN domain-containing protein [Gemmatimonadota bacterium]
MVTREDLESFLIRMDLDYEELDEGMYLVKSRNGGPPIVIHHSEPLLLIRVKVMDLPDSGEGLEELYRRLLVLNATDVVHGAYGVEEDEVILSDTLELETLDFAEIQASLESVQMAVSSHLEQIKALAEHEED